MKKLIIFIIVALIWGCAAEPKSLPTDKFLIPAPPRRPEVKFSLVTPEKEGLYKVTNPKGNIALQEGDYIAVEYKYAPQFFAYIHSMEAYIEQLTKHPVFEVEHEKEETPK